MNLFLTKEALYQLSYVGNSAIRVIREYRAVEIMERETRFELATSSLEG
jgi:hypothetical protein